jgi:hypothetical protein
MVFHLSWTLEIVGSIPTAVTKFEILFEQDFDK